MHQFVHRIPRFPYGTPSAKDGRNEHYFDAEEDYTLYVQGAVSIKLVTEHLEADGPSDEQIAEEIGNGEISIEVAGTKVIDSEY